MKNSLSTTIFACVVVLCTAFPTQDEFLNGYYEYEQVNIDAKVAQSYSGEITYNIKTKAFGENFDLHLKKLPSIFSENFQLLFLELDNRKNPLYTKVKSKNGEEPVFRDSKTNSILYVEYGKGALQLEGSLTPELSIVHSSKFGLNSKNGNHVVVKTNYKKTFIDRTFSFKGQYHEIKANASIDALELPDPVRPELLVIVDYKNARRLQFDNVEIQKYLAIFWHAVNTRYELVTNPKIQLLVVGAVINKDVSWQPYIEQSRVTDKGQELINLNSALPWLNHFLHENIKLLPKYDLAMLMTGEDMADREKADNYVPEVAGAAYVASACSWATPNNAGMAEDAPPFFTGVLHHAHEIGHILGAVHDEEGPVNYIPGHPGAKQCPFKDGYLMSYRLGSKNHLRWSDCTIKQFRFYVRQPFSKCLRQISNTANMTLNSTLPGQIVSLDDQCRAALGPDAIYFNIQTPDTICAILYCSYKGDSGNGELNAKARGPALEGSPCGKSFQKWCHNGECVPRPA